jgi:DNA-binding Lrp family transcriptional regulator
MTDLDDIDRRILRILRDRPRVPVAELARLASVARGTAQARLDRLEATGVVVGYGPDVDPGAIGFDVLAFVTLEIAQGRGDAVIAHLAAIPEVLEVHAVTGPGDLLCRIAARSNRHLDEVLQRVLAAPETRRTITQLSLSTRLVRSAVDLATA